jgi:hypothetical protein
MLSQSTVASEASGVAEVTAATETKSEGNLDDVPMAFGRTTANMNSSTSKKDSKKDSEKDNKNSKSGKNAADGKKKSGAKEKAKEKDSIAFSIEIWERLAKHVRYNCMKLLFSSYLRFLNARLTHYFASHCVVLCCGVWLCYSLH